MRRINHPISLTSFHIIASRRHKTWFTILVLLVLTGMACNAESAINPATSTPTYTFVPFSQKDCAVPGFPAPDSMEIYPTSIYCQFTVNGWVKGSVDLTLEYIKDAETLKTVYAGIQKSWNATLQAADQVTGAENRNMLDETTHQSAIVVFPDTERPGEKPNAEILDLSIYRDHFIVYVTGGLSETSLSDAIDTMEKVINYAIKTADNHYKK